MLRPLIFLDSITVIIFGEIANWYSSGLWAGCSRGWEFFSSPPRLTPYPMGTRGSFPGGKTVGAWSWPLTSF